MNKAQKECVDKWATKSLTKDTLADISYISQDHRYRVVEQFFQEFNAIDPTQDTIWQIRNFGGGNPSLGLALSNFDSREAAEKSQLEFIHELTSGSTSYELISFDEAGVTYRSNAYTFTRAIVETH